MASPRALRRASGLIVRDVAGEQVVFNTATGQVTALSGVALDVWNAVETGAWPDAPQQEIGLAIEHLLNLGLLVEPGMTRRALLVRSGAVATAAGIATIAAPTAAYASSGKKHATVLIATNNTSPPSGGTYTVTVTVDGGTGNPSPTGNVSVVDGNGNTVAGPSALLAGTPSTRQFTITNGAGTTPTVLHAVYGGDANYLNDVSGTITENPYTVTMTYTLSTTKKNTADTVTVTATVSGGGVAALNGETVVLSGSDARISGTGTFNASGVATIAITNPTSSGTYTFQLDYAGDATHAAAQTKNTSQAITNA